MIIEEMVGDRIRHVSDSGFKIRQIETGAIYDDALDIVPCPYTYEETDEPIEEMAKDISAEEALDIILGNDHNDGGEGE